MNDLHIGELIEARLAEIGMTKAEFGRRIYQSRQQVNLLVQKDSLDCKLLLRISKVLERNFFAPLLEELGEAERELRDVVREVLREEMGSLKSI